jgi:hypothetical protein
MTTRDVCPFCRARFGPGGAKRSVEDVVPRWLAAELPKGTVRTEVSAARDLPPHRSHVSKTVKVVANRVCQDCNNGWMSRLEGAVKPFLRSIIHGHRRTYYGDGQRLLAAWAVKTALMFELVNPDVELRRPIEDEHYARMRAAEQTPPAKTQVWLGAYQGPSTIWHWGKDIEVNAGHPDVAHGFTTTMVFGPVVLHVFGHVHPSDFAIELDGDRAEMGLQIWPHQSAVTWPPARVMGEDDLRRFARMFEEVGALRRIQLPGK